MSILTIIKVLTEKKKLEYSGHKLLPADICIGLMFEGINGMIVYMAEP